MAKEKVTISVEDRLRALHQLQIIDSEVDKIRIVRGELPVEIEDLEDLIVGLKTRLEKLTNELEVVNTDLTAKKTSILDASELVKKYDKQLKNIKNNREFSSLTKELEYKNLEIELNEKHVNDLQAKILHKNEVIEASTLQINERECIQTRQYCLLLTDPPHTSSTPLQNHLFSTPLLNIAITFKQ